MDIYYINSINEKVYLDRYPYRMLSVTGLFNYEYKYEKKRNNTVKNIKKDMRTAPVSIDISGKSFSEYYENVVKLYEIIDYDADHKCPTSIDGTPVPIINDIINEEVLLFVNMI